MVREAARRPGFLDAALGAFQMVRPLSCLKAGLFTLLGAYLSLPLGRPLPHRAFTGALVMALVVASGFALNDWADAEGDLANHPRRAIPSGRLSRRAALAAAGMLALLALVAARPLGAWAVALLNASLLLFGALAVGRLSWYLMAVSALAFLFTWVYEVLLSPADPPGDRRFGIRTTAVRLGLREALQLSTILWLAMILLPMSMTVASEQPLGFLAAVCLGLNLPLVYLRRGLSGSAIRRDRLRRAGLLMSMTRISSLLSITFLLLTLVGG